MLFRGRVFDHYTMAVCLNAVPWPCVRPLRHGCVLQDCVTTVCFNIVSWLCARILSYSCVVECCVRAVRQNQGSLSM
jgi:hypothetical protein